MAQKNLIEKDTYVCVYNIKDRDGKILNNLELNVGKEILKSDDDYEEYVGKLYVESEDLDSAVFDYVKEIYPDFFTYEYEVD